MKKIWFVMLAFMAVIFTGAIIAKAQHHADSLLSNDTAQVQVQPDPSGAQAVKNSINSQLLKREVKEVTKIKPVNLLRGFFGLAALRLKFPT